MQKIKNSMLYGLIYAVASYFLYKSYIVSLFILITFFLLRYMNKKYYQKKENKMMLVAFYDYLICLLYQFNYSVNFYNSMVNACDEYIKIYGENRFSMVVVKSINSQKVNPQQMAYLIYIKESLDMEEVSDFINSTIICLERGNDISDNIKNSIAVIKDKIETKQQIEVVITQKKTEQLIISLMPFAIIAIFSMTANSYLDVMYHSLVGRVMMTIAGLLFFVQTVIGRKMIEIEV